MVLERVGIDWERLVALARRALGDRMQRRHITLDDDRYERALDFYVEVGLRWAERYDPAKSKGQSFVTTCYRRMLPKLTDFLRQEHGDARRGTPLFQVATDPSMLPATAAMAEASFDDAVESVSAALPSRPLWTLHHLARPMAEEGVTLAVAAAAARVSEDDAAELLEELGWHLGRRPSADGPVGDPIFDLLLEWSVAA